MAIVVGDRAERTHGEGRQHPATLLLQDVAKRCARDPALRPQPIEARRLLQGAAGEEHAGRQQCTEAVEDPPTPGIQRVAGQFGREQRRQAHREKRSDLTGGRGPTGHVPAASWAGDLEQIDQDAGVLTADREPHQATQHRQQHTRARSDLCVRGQQRRDRHGRGHHPGRDDQGDPPAHPIPEVTEEHRPHRAHQIGSGEDTVGEDRGVRAVEEDPAQHRREIQIEAEVVPLHDGPERRDPDRASRYRVDRWRIRHAHQALSAQPRSSRPCSANRTGPGRAPVRAGIRDRGVRRTIRIPKGDAFARQRP